MTTTSDSYLGIANSNQEQLPLNLQGSTRLNSPVTGTPYHSFLASGRRSRQLLRTTGHSQLTTEYEVQVILYYVDEELRVAPANRWPLPTCYVLLRT
jgi:hypothetical protein